MTSCSGHHCDDVKAFFMRSMTDYSGWWYFLIWLSDFPPTVAIVAAVGGASGCWGICIAYGACELLHLVGPQRGWWGPSRDGWNTTNKTYHPHHRMTIVYLYHIVPSYSEKQKTLLNVPFVVAEPLSASWSPSSVVFGILACVELLDWLGSLLAFPGCLCSLSCISLCGFLTPVCVRCQQFLWVHCAFAWRRNLSLWVRSSASLACI